MKKYTLKDFYDLLNEKEQVVESAFAEEAVVDFTTYNSKEVVANTLFICKGATFKEDYLKDAISKGATCYVSEKNTMLIVHTLLLKTLESVCL